MATAAGGLAKSTAVKPNIFFGRRLIRRLTKLQAYIASRGKNRLDNNSLCIGPTGLRLRHIGMTDPQCDSPILLSLGPTHLLSSSYWLYGRHHAAEPTCRDADARHRVT